MPKLRFKRVYLVMGIPQSGKTCFVQQFKQWWTVISADDIKKELYGGEWQWYANHGTFKELLTQFRKALYSPAAYTDRIFLDYTFTNLASRKQIYKIIEQARHSYNIKTRVIIIVMDTPLAVCLERNKNRNIPISEKVIRRQHKRELIISRDECPYLKGRFFIYEEIYPDLPWFVHRVHAHFDSCCKAIDGCIKGGDEDAILANWSNTTEPSHSSNPSNPFSDVDLVDLYLAAMGVHQKETKSYLQSVANAKRAIEDGPIRRLIGFTLRQITRAAIRKR